MKQYIGISRDHSGSMSTLTEHAMRDYNLQISAIREASESNDIDTIVSVVRCGGGVEREVVNSSISRLKPLTTYKAPGNNTPLLDSVMTLVRLLEAVPDVHEEDVSFLIVVITDGLENASTVSPDEVARTIQRLQATDRWTFTFRVPHGCSSTLTRLGIPIGNIQEWIVSREGLERSSVATTNAIRNYYSGRMKGVRSTGTFYADLSGVSKQEVRAALTNISHEVQFLHVGRGCQSIRDFVERETGEPMKIGSAFYQLTKSEKQVQHYKLIALRDKKTGAVYVGQNARELLNLPDRGTIRLEPGNSPDYDIFVQSTSTNRKLVVGTEVMYWPQSV